MISLLHCKNHGCFLEISGKSIKQAANWLLSVHVRSLHTHFPLNGVTGSEFIALRMRKCAQSADVSSQTSSKKKIRLALARLYPANLVMYRLPHEKKNYGFAPNLDFNPLPTRFNYTKFLPPSGVCCTSGEKRTSKHGISILLKLVSIEYQKRDAFLAAL